MSTHTVGYQLAQGYLQNYDPRWDSSCSVKATSLTHYHHHWTTCTYLYAEHQQ